MHDALGRPFFAVSKALNNGLADSLLADIVPELPTRVPGPPTADELAADPSPHRFVRVFDREGATHRLPSALWRHRIGGLTCRNNVEDVWPASALQEQEVRLPEGGSTRVPLALRETRLGAGDDGPPVAEVRRLTPTGHQTAVITTARHLGNTVIAGRTFARWRQENFCAYMIKHFDIDGLLEYGAEAIPGTLEVVNPPLAGPRQSRSADPAKGEKASG